MAELLWDLIESSPKLQESILAITTSREDRNDWLDYVGAQ
jgi:hypothetical protein